MVLRRYMILYEVDSRFFGADVGALTAFKTSASVLVTHNAALHAVDATSKHETILLTSGAIREVKEVSTYLKQLAHEV